MPAGRTLKRTSTEDGSVSPPPSKRQQQQQQPQVVKAASTTTQKAVSSFFTPTSQKQPDPMSWRIVHNTLLVGTYHNAGVKAVERGAKGVKIAAFDFDSTLIQPQSTRKFSKDAADWKFWHPTIPSTLTKLSSTHRLFILSNQGGIPLADPKARKRLSDFKTKVSAVLTHLDSPVTIYAATGKDRFRKPRTGMWETLLSDSRLKPDEIDVENSIFVGDAAGRHGDDGGVQGKDHSCSDRDFAANIGIPFKTPEEYFVSEAPRPFKRKFDPKIYLSLPSANAPAASDEGAGSSTEASEPVIERRNPLDVVVLVGSPGAGKSTFFWRHLAPLGYHRVNQDLLKTRDKCLKVAAEYLENRESVAVDATNADPETRKYWVDLAGKYGIPIRCVLLNTDTLLAQHNDTVRALCGISPTNDGTLASPSTAPKDKEKAEPQAPNDDITGNITFNPEARTMLPGMAFGSFTKRYREPTLKEGFQDIVRVPFRFEGSESNREVWGKYWLS